jgi:acyl CoA:acetate/3-ketoacid CoA transferase beta subunit
MRAASFNDLISLIAAAKPNARIQVPSGLTQSNALIAALQANPSACQDKVFAGLFIPGVDTFDYTGLHPIARMETPLMAPHLREGLAAGRVWPLQCSYRKAYQRLARSSQSHPATDIGIAVMTPGEGDTLSFALAADAGPAILTGAHIKVALVNETAPRLPNARTTTAPRSAFDLIIGFEEPLNWVTTDPSPTGPLATIADRVASHIRGGDVLQFGIGKLPGTVLSNVAKRITSGGLKIHSGLYGEGVADLLDAGSLASSEDAMLAGVSLGSAALGERLAANTHARFAPVSITHDPRRMSQHAAFTAINGALQVDLFGQVNAEFVGSRLVSGPGGMPDFVAGANLAAAGRAIIAMPASAGSESRIVPKLETPWVTVPRGLIHLVVTEFGTADLRDKDLDATATALIAIAPPDHRDRLNEAWGHLRRALAPT